MLVVEWKENMYLHMQGAIWHRTERRAALFAVPRAERSFEYLLYTDGLSRLTGKRKEAGRIADSANFLLFDGYWKSQLKEIKRHIQ